MAVPVLTPRAQFRIFLENQLKMMQGSNSPQASLLRVAIEGLVALNYGETQPIFRPSDIKGSHGTRPYTIRKLKMQALGFAVLLKANHYKPTIHTVATAYGETADVFTSWRKDKRLGKTTDTVMKSFRDEIANLAWDQAHILKLLKEAGSEYRWQKKWRLDIRNEGCRFADWVSIHPLNVRASPKMTFGH
jgi:hypothetical protein